MPKRQCLFPAYAEYRLSFPNQPSDEAIKDFLKGLCDQPSEVAEECMGSLTDEQAGCIWRFIGREYGKEQFGWNVKEILAGLEKNIFA